MMARGVSWAAAAAIALGVVYGWPLVCRAVWPSYTALMKHSDYNMFVWGTWLLHTLVFVSGNLFYTVLYMADFSFLRKYKVEKKPWPWQQSPKVRAEYFSLTRKAVALVTLNNTVVTLPLAMFGFTNAVARGFHTDEDRIPEWTTMAWQLVVFMVIEDTMFYWGHRFLHLKFIYPYIHKLHHKYNNQNSTIGIASEFTHPVEFVIGNIIPFTMGPMLLASHHATCLLWVLVRISETIDGHCGYAWPWAPWRVLPMAGGAAEHDFHHSHNTGNYGSFFTHWDALMGTNATFVEWQKARQAKAR